MTKRSNTAAPADNLLLINAPSPAPSPVAAEPAEAAAPAGAAATDDLAQLEAEEIQRQAEAAGETAPGAPGKPASAVEIDLPTADVFNMLLTPLAMIGAPNWRMTPAEIKMLSEAYGRVFDKYFPDFTKYMGAELVAVLVTLTVFTPRIASGQPPRPPKKATVDASSTEVKSQPA